MDEQLKSFLEEQNEMNQEQQKANTESAKRNLTRGEKSVGLTFNPSGDPRVNEVKQHCADMIDLLNGVHDSREVSPSWEVSVFRTEAFNKIIAAQMALVKYLTYRD